MTLSSNRIIKVRKPLKKLVLSSHSGPGKKDGFEEGLGKKKEELVQLPQSEFMQELQFSFQKGLDEGKLAGYQQAEQDFSKKVKYLESVISEIENERKNILNQSETLLLDLTLKISEKILHEVPPFMPDLIKSSLENILDELRSESEITILMNPEDVEEFKAIKASLVKSLPNLDKLALKKDPRIARGGCMIDTQNGKIDARLETRISTLMKELRKELASFAGQDDD